MPEPVSNVRPFKRPAPTPVRRAMPARAAIWDLPSGCLCPVVGTCMSVDELRVVLDALFGGTSGAGDFELHAGVVRECGARNKVSELVQRELDARYATDVAALTAADAAGLARAWTLATASGDVAGTLWAVLTHGRCDDTLRERLLCDVHMAQHHAVAEHRRLLRASDRLQRENDRLREQVAALGRERGAFATGLHP